ncbi:ABC transporter permease [Guggenheimella bovis]
MNGIRTALWEKWIEFKFEWKRITLASMVTPLLYMIALGWGLGRMAKIEGHQYIEFLVPGIIAMTTMNNSFSAVATTLNVQRLFEHSFEQVIISPTSLYEYVLGQSLGGSLRGVYSGLIIFLLALPFGLKMALTPLFLMIMVLNGLIFGSMGVLAAIIAESHADASRVSTFLITPMTFLCNTFFPLDETPLMVQRLIQLLPLTHTSSSLRAIAYGEHVNPVSILILVIYALVFIMISNVVIHRRKDF